MGLKITVGTESLTPHQLERIQQINRPVGPIKLYMLARLVADVYEAQGRELKLAQDGYRSCYAPEMLDEPMKKFLAPKRFTPDRKRLTAAVSRVRKHLKGLGMNRPLDLDEAYLKVLAAKENKLAGLPTMGSKGEDTEALSRAYACLAGKCPPPVVIGHRGKNTRVARAVWMFPFEWHIVEAAFFYPLQEKMKANVRIYAAENAVARRALLSEAATSGSFHSKVAMDYSGFDGSIGTQLIGIAFNLLKEHMLLDGKMEKVWSRVATYFATCPFYDQYARLISGRRGGVPSGSMFTQLVDTVVNALVIEYVFADMKQKHYWVYGDDSLTLLPCSVQDARDLMESVAESASHLGITVNLSKTHVCGPCDTTTFLGHYDLRRGRPEEDVIGRLIYPERPFVPTAENLLRRVVSYLAESDEAARVLVPVYYILRAMVSDPQANWEYSAAAKSGIGNWTRVDMPHGSGPSVNPRDLPGILQYLATEDPTITSSYLRIRAAV